MTRAQRALHARLWMLLGPALLLALLAAVLARPAPPGPSAAPSTTGAATP